MTLNAADPLSFTAEARCRSMDPNDFFYEFDQRFQKNSAEQRAHREKLRAICTTCPVLIQCGEYVNATKQQAGFWAAETPGERHKRWRAERAAAKVAS